MAVPHFVIKNRFQQYTRTGQLYNNLLSNNILEDICNRITGLTDFTVSYTDETNEGQLATLTFGDDNFYIFLFQKKDARNASFQSFPTALLKSLNDDQSNGIFCYFLPLTEEEIPRIKTNYFKFMYRLMKTVGTNFINEELLAPYSIQTFQTVEDIILAKNNIRGRNSGNNSSYITKSADDVIQVFGKLYGANKYETSLLCIALYRVSINNIELFEIEEGNLKKLPRVARVYLLSLERFSIVNATITLEQSEYRENNSLRSPRYIYNLLEKLGDKKCALCDCEIPQIIQGAHIWPVADIKVDVNYNQEEKLSHAINGDNGLWLCSNHHKLLDTNIIRLFNDSSVKIKTTLSDSQRNYLNEVTTVRKIPNDIVNENFVEYLTKRNQNIPEELYAELTA
ncbi:HNH endonuclease [Tenacibaculum finnmarkense]|uniref:HNH endonuclease signature motif containing protein n=1 Tax=Tenacibaculum finnmarkense TaxID=2781243 RepID=UPI001EFC0251|nr:HNH endonuclease signature motif containing protein [Tenacibaculum finnmarkense]MCG8902238.1 HNH endonuclease [Tenacibaculum finnmarkense]